MQKPTILFIQGGGEGAHAIDHKLVLSLTHALKDACTMVYPGMPEENDPDYERWKAAIEKELHKIEGPVILVAHSVGSFLLLKYILESKIDKNIIGIFLIATPFVGEGGWQFEDMAIKEATYSKHLPAPVFFYHSTGDETVPFSHLSRYEKMLPDAAFRKIAGRDHQLNNDLSEVVEDLKSIL
jgi:predicted alpha/beta hydrolase family esterase